MIQRDHPISLLKPRNELYHDNKKKKEVCRSKNRSTTDAKENSGMIDRRV